MGTVIDSIGDRQMQNNLTASTAILAGLVLEQEVIQRLLRRDTMRESVIYQMIKEEGIEEGKQEGRQEGRQEGSQQKAREIALNLIAEGMGIEAVARITGLTVEVVQQLQQRG